jgi:hypothetical protein
MGDEIFYPHSNILSTVYESRPHTQAMCVLSRAPPYVLLASEGRIICAAENSWLEGIELRTSALLPS